MESNQKYNKSDKNSIEIYLKTNKNNLKSVYQVKFSQTSHFFGRGLFKYYLDTIFTHDLVDEIWKYGIFLRW